MSRSCGICARQDGLELSEALRLGKESIGAVARRSGASRQSLRRHAKGCLGLGEVGAAPRKPRGRPNDSAGVAGKGPESGGVEDLVVVSTACDPHPLENARATGPLNSDLPHRITATPVTQTAMAVNRPLSSGRLPPPPPGLDSDPDTRALYIADLMSRARWDRTIAAELAVRWGGISDATIRNYARQASVVLQADRGSLAHQVEVSIAYTSSQRDDATKQAERNEEIAEEARRLSDECDAPADQVRALQTETFARKHAAQYRTIALSWQEHLDKVQGVLRQAAPSVQVNVLSVAQSVEFETLITCVLAELETAPKMRERVINRIRRELDARRGQRRGDDALVVAESVVDG